MWLWILLLFVIYLPAKVQAGEQEETAAIMDALAQQRREHFVACQKSWEDKLGLWRARLQLSPTPEPKRKTK